MRHVLPLTLRITYPTRRAVLAEYRVDGNTLSLFVPTPTTVALGGEVRLDVGFGDSDAHFMLGGKVTWRRAEARGMRQEPGLGVNFTGADKGVAARMLAFCAGKPMDQGTSGDPRYPARIPVQVTLGKRQFKAMVRDISSTGAFVQTPQVGGLAPGRELKMVLEPGWFGLGGKPLVARVVWTGDAKGVRGFGARFVGLPGEVRPALRKYLA